MKSQPISPLLSLKMLNLVLGLSSIFCPRANNANALENMKADDIDWNSSEDGSV